MQFRVLLLFKLGRGAEPGPRLAGEVGARVAEAGGLVPGAGLSPPSLALELGWECALVTELLLRRGPAPDAFLKADPSSSGVLSSPLSCLFFKAEMKWTSHNSLQQLQHKVLLGVLFCSGGMVA